MVRGPQSVYNVPVEPRFLTAQQFLITTLVFKIAIIALLATMLVRYRRFGHILIFERRGILDRAILAFSLGIPLTAGVAGRILLRYDAADLTLDAMTSLTTDGQLQAQGEVTLNGGTLNADLSDTTFEEVNLKSAPAAAGQGSLVRLNNSSIGQARFTGNSFDVDASGATFASALFESDALGFDD